MAKFKEDTKIKGSKGPAAQRCNRNHPLSPYKRRERRQAEARMRQQNPDLALQEKLKLVHPNRHLPKNAHAEITKEVVEASVGSE